MAGADRKNFRDPDEVREFTYGRAEIVRMGGGEVGRLVTGDETAVAIDWGGAHIWAKPMN